MDIEAHRAQHLRLHKALDELVADWIAQRKENQRLSTFSLLHFMEWSAEQCSNPTGQYKREE